MAGRLHELLDSINPYRRISLLQTQIQSLQRQLAGSYTHLLEASALKLAEESKRISREENQQLISLRDDVTLMHSQLSEMATRLMAPEEHKQQIENRLDELARSLAVIREYQLRLELAVDAARSSSELTDSDYSDLAQYRAGKSYSRVYEEENPLVSVCIATYNRGELLTQRCLPSVLGQDYPNLEVIVVGDGCTDETPELVRQLNDPRIHFVNLEEHTPHPDDSESSWLMSGGPCENHARLLARGELISQVDDDDEYLPDRISTLVRVLQETRGEVIWHPFWFEDEAGNWAINDSPDFRWGMITTGSILYRAWFKRFSWHPRAYLGGEPTDWFRYRKFRHVGAVMVRHAEALLRHYRERNRPYLT